MVEKILSEEAPRSIKISLISNISHLADFFGQDKTNEVCYLMRGEKGIGERR